MVDLKDEEVYENFLNGDIDSIEIIYNKYRNDLVNFSKSIVKSLEVAEEIVQDIFTKILSKPNAYDKNYTVRSFLFLVCYRKSITYINKWYRRKSVEEKMAKNQTLIYTDDLSEKIIKIEETELIDKALQLLKLEYRIVLELTEFHGFSTKEAARILNKTEGATKTLKCRAKDSLRKIIDDKFNYEENRHHKNVLKTIILILCASILSFGAVYATVKTIKSVLKAPEYFDLDNYNDVIEIKSEYITKEEAKKNIKKYLELLGCNYNDSIDIELYKDIIQNDKVYWRYIDDYVEIRIDVIYGKIVKFAYKDYRNFNGMKKLNLSNLNELLKQMEIIKESENALYEIDRIIIFNKENIDCKELIYYSNSNIIIIKYIPKYQYIINICIESINCVDDGNRITYENCIKLIEEKYDVDKILSVKIKRMQINYLIPERNIIKQRIKFSNEYRIAWNVEFIDKNRKKISVSIDCTTGEIIEESSKI